MGRAYFFNNLVRTVAIRGVKLNCLAMEEELTRRYAESHGYKLYKNGCLLSDHYSNPVRYRDEKYKLIVTRKSLPDWGPVEAGRVDAISGVTFFAALGYFCFRFFLNVLKALVGLIEEEKKNILYLKGYFASRREEPIVNKEWRIGVKNKLTRTIFH